MPLNLHLGCGRVYLEDFINIDMNGINVDDASKDQIKDNKTTISKYYKYKLDDVIDKDNRPVIYDIEDDICNLEKFIRNSHILHSDMVDYIVCVQVLEHLEIEDIVQGLKTWYRLLKNGGKILITVPDILLSYEAYKNRDIPNEEALFRLIYGTKKNRHITGFTEFSLSQLMELVGFKIIETQNIKHDYPVIELTGIKCDIED